MSRCAWKAARCCSERSAAGLLFEHDLFGKAVPTFPDHALAIAIESGPVTGNGLDRRIGRFGGSGRRAGAGQRYRTAGGGGGRGHGKSAWPLPRHGYRSTDRLFRGENLGRRRACCWRCGRGKGRQPRCGEVRRVGRIRIRPGEAAVRGTRGAGRRGIVIRSRRQERPWRRRSGQGAACKIGRHVSWCGPRGLSHRSPKPHRRAAAPIDRLEMEPDWVLTVRPLGFVRTGW